MISSILLIYRFRHLFKENKQKEMERMSERTGSGLLVCTATVAPPVVVAAAAATALAAGGVDAVGGVEGAGIVWRAPTSESDGSVDDADTLGSFDSASESSSPTESLIRPTWPIEELTVKPINT